jgi:hypothetical protein
MDNEKLLDEIEQWLDNHGYINGIGFSEHGLLERIVST